MILSFFHASAILACSWLSMKKQRLAEIVADGVTVAAVIQAAEVAQVKYLISASCGL